METNPKTPTQPESGAATTTAIATGLARVHLVPRRVRLLPTVFRRIEQVTPPLRDLFRDLVSGRARWPLYLYGNIGRGKTLAALCLADISRTASYHTVESLCDEVMAPGQSSAAMWESIAQKDLAILDELGARKKDTDLPYTTVKNFADTRAIEAQNKVVYVSNLHPAAFREMYDDRIASRLLCGTWHELTGPDRRMSR